jgi:hypothetical protein
MKYKIAKDETDTLTIERLLIALDKKPEEAIEYFKKLGLQVSDNWKDTLKAIRNDAFAIAGVKNMDNLLAIKELIIDAMEGEIPVKDFKKFVAEQLNLKTWHGALVVSQNISNSRAAGEYQKALDTMDDFPLLRPITILDSKTTEICTWLHNHKFAIKINDTGLKNFFHPRHFRCRTIWVPITYKQAKRLNLVVKNTKDIDEKYWNQVEFRRLPNTPFLKRIDISKYPKELIEQFNKILKN